MSMNPMALQAVPMASAPNVVTTGNVDSQTILIQAMLANMKPDQAASVQAALAAQARRAANAYYLDNTIRKVTPALTNGSITQAYALGTPLTFNLTTALNSFCEGILLRWTINYTLATGTSAVYGLTPGGILATIDSVDVRYNKGQHHVRPQVFRELALMGALEDYVIPESVLAGQQQAGVQSYLNTTMPVAVGAQTATCEIFIPFNMLGSNDPRGLLPIIVGDTGVQVIVNTPQSLYGSDPILNALYGVSGTGQAVSAVSGTVEVSAVYRDGDQGMSSDRLPFDMGSVDGTFQMQIDNVLQPLIAGAYQRTRLQIMGRHYYVICLVVDGLQSNQYATDANIAYVESAKDGAGSNVFWRYGTQTNMSVNEWRYLNRLDFKQDLDQGVIPFWNTPVLRQGDPHLRKGKQYLDNSRAGWPDWRYNVTVNSVGNGTLNGLPCTPRIEPHVFYINPTGLVPVTG